MPSRTIRWSLMFGLLFTVSAFRITERPTPITIPLNQPTVSGENVFLTGDAYRFAEESKRNNNETTLRNGEGKRSDDKTTYYAMMIPLRPTITGPEKFDATDDANLIYEELERHHLDCFLDTLMSIMGNRTGHQRDRILWKLEYWYGETAYNSTMLKWKRGGFGIEPLLFLSLARVLNAHELDVALDDTNGYRILEVLLPLNKHDRNKTLNEYKFQFDEEFLDDLKNFERPKNYMSIVHTICNDARNGSSNVTEGGTEKVAEVLVTLLEGSEKVNLTVLNSILLTTDSDELRLINRKYLQLTNHTIRVALNEQFSGQLLHEYKTIVKLTVDTPKYFAEKLNKAIHKKKPRFKTINSILIGRSEIDLGNINLFYHHLYGRHLSDDLKKITTGRHQQLLLTLLGEFDYDDYMKNNRCNCRCKYCE